MTTNLAQLVAGVDDITDPTCMINILDYLEKLQMEDEEFMRILVDRVSSMDITWEQPWYQKSNSLTRRSTQSEDAGGSFRMDRFSLNEDKKLKKNWRKFRKKFDVPDTPICLARWRNKKCKRPDTPEERARHYVISFLAQGLERTLFQVNTHFIAYYGAPNQGSFTSVEEKIMKICHLHEPIKAVRYLTKILGRQQRGLCYRLKSLNMETYSDKSEKPKAKRMKWTLTRATKLVKSLMKHSDKKLKELKNARFELAVWLKVEKDMGEDYSILQQAWYRFLHVQIFVKYDIKLRRLRKKLLKKLQLSPYRIWKDISWRKLSHEFPEGFTLHFLYHVLYTLLRTYPSKILSVPIDELVTYGREKMNKKKHLESKRLKLLALNENGDLEFVQSSLKLP